MTTLFGALAEGLWTRADENPPVEAGADEEGAWSTVFDIANEVFCSSEDEDLDPSRTFPLRLVFDDNAYDEWRDKHKPTRDDVASIRRLRSAFQDYLVPIMPLATEDLAVVTTTFKRVNSSGTPMDELHMARALAYREDFDFIAEIQRGILGLESIGWGDLDPSIVLKVVAGIMGLDPMEFDVEALAAKVSERGSESIQAACGAIGVVVSELIVMGFAGPRLLPAAYTLVLGAVAIHQVQGPDHAVSGDFRGKLRAWIATYLLLDKFSSQPHVLRTLKGRLEADFGVPSKVRRVKPRSPVESTKFNLAWSRSKTIAVALADRSPRDPNNTKYEHPARLLLEHGSAAVPQLLHSDARGVPDTVRARLREWARTLGADLARPANRFLCAPSDAEALRGWLLGGNAPDDALASHLLDREGVEHLHAGRFTDFFRKRRDAVRHAEEAWAARHGASTRVIKVKG